MQQITRMTIGTFGVHFVWKPKNNDAEGLTSKSGDDPGKTKFRGKDRIVIGTTQPYITNIVNSNFSVRRREVVLAVLEVLNDAQKRPKDK